MNNLNKGQHYGTSKNILEREGLIISSSLYHNQMNCPLHYHANAHFALTTKGNLTETHRNGKIQLSAGCLIYNHSQEPHFNSDYSELVSALHVDIDTKWFTKYGLKQTRIEGLHVIENPILKNLFIKLYKEVKFYDAESELTIESILIQAISELGRNINMNENSTPPWVSKLTELLHFNCTNEVLTLEKIASNINIHPVYLCQQFPVYFNCTFGEYVRKIRIEKSVTLMLRNPLLKLTEIAYECGFSDQSHFIRLFKKHIGINPLAYLKMTRE